MLENPLLLFHVVSGTIGLTTGYWALLLKKGSPRHRVAGNTFVVAMIAMGLSGALLAWFRPATISIITGLLMVYLVSTAWLAARRNEPLERLFHGAGLLLATGLCAWYFITGAKVSASPTGFIEGVLIPAGYYYFFGIISGLCAAGDLLLVARGGLTGPQLSARYRLARHLWRMCLAFLIAASSLFQGNPQLFPEPLQGSLLLSLPVLFILGATVYWLVRVWFSKWYQNAKSTFKNRSLQKRA